ncbi:MAG TPA: hypothetical protein VGS19_37855 [Streptosporangiaceae bacterium]|nr:hypothetical protein [Streptosporangiaceae bacterium]
MTTTTQPDKQETTRRLAALRGNCMGAAVLLIIQFGLGMGINLYVTLPKNKTFLSIVFSSATVAAHVVVGVAILGAAVAALVRAIRSRKVVVFASLGLAAVLVAWAAGSAFASNQSNGASLGMALATAVAMFSYLAAVFSLR